MAVKQFQIVAYAATSMIIVFIIKMVSDINRAKETHYKHVHMRNEPARLTELARLQLNTP